MLPVRAAEGVASADCHLVASDRLRSDDEGLLAEDR